MSDFHPSVRNTMMFHQLLPGYAYGLQDPSDSFYMRQLVAFQNNVETLGPSTQATVNISNNEAFLDMDNSYLQCYVEFKQQFADSTDVGSINVGKILDQFASSIVQRMTVKCGGQTLSDFQQFSDYHHIKMLTEDTSCEQMAYFSESASMFPTLGSAVNYSDATSYSDLELQKYIQIYGKQPAGANYLSTYNDLIKQRMIEDVKRASKFYELGTAVGATGATNVNIVNKPLTTGGTNNMDLYCILLKLSDIPCFSSKQYFPMFAINGPLQIQIYWQPFENCTHDIGFSRGASGLIAGSNTYTIYKLECIAGLIYPKPDFIDKYLLDVVSTGNAIYKGKWVDFGQQSITGTSSTLLFNVSMARLTESIYVKKEMSTTVNSQTQETKRYTLTDTAQIGGYAWRGNKWYSPLGKNLQIYNRINGVTYPNANGSVLTNEHLIKEQTEEALGKLIGLKDERRFFFDQQILAFSYKKDTHSSPLQDVSGLNLAQNNQVQLIYQHDVSCADNTAIFAWHIGEILIQFTPQGSLLLFR